MVELPSTTCTIGSFESVPHRISRTNSIFGPHVKKKLPIASSIPLRFAYKGELVRASAKTKHLLNILNEVEPVSHAHSVNLAAHSYNFGRFLGLPQTELNLLYYGSLLHDIGKIYFDSLLKAPRKLEPEERKYIQNHVLASYILLSKNNYTRFIRVAGLYHHYAPENYPQSDTSLYVALKETSNEIGISVPTLELIRFDSLTSQEKYLLSIISLLDVFDALIDINRPYKKGIPLRECISILQPMWGTRFSPSLKSTFMQYALWLMHYPQQAVAPYAYEHHAQSL